MGSLDDDWVRTTSAQPSVAEAAVCCRFAGVRSDVVAVVLAATKRCRGTGISLR